MGCFAPRVPARRVARRAVATVALLVALCSAATAHPYYWAEVGTSNDLMCICLHRPSWLRCGPDATGATRCLPKHALWAHAQRCTQPQPCLMPNDPYTPVAQRAGCTSHPSSGQKGHGPPSTDAGITFSVTSHDRSLRLCPGGSLTVTVTLPAARELLLTSNVGNLGGGDTSW